MGAPYIYDISRLRVNTWTPEYFLGNVLCTLRSLNTEMLIYFILTEALKKRFLDKIVQNVCAW